MSKVQFIKTTGGEELAVIPRAEYDRLVARAEDEDIGTARIVRRGRMPSWRRFITASPLGEGS